MNGSNMQQMEFTHKSAKTPVRCLAGSGKRLAIARVWIRKSPVLLMDESTSSLDPATAQEIERMVFELPNVMVLFVTHHAQPGTYEKADYVLHIEHGILREIRSKKAPGNR